MEWESHANGTMQETTFCNIRVVVIKQNENQSSIIVHSANPLIPLSVRDIKESDIDTAKTEALRMIQQVIKTKTYELDALNCTIITAIKDLENKPHATI